MGRKHHKYQLNEHDKHDNNDDKKEKQLQQYENDTEKLNEIRESKEQIIWDTRIKMLSYCDDNGIPLCDYLNVSVFESFIKYLDENR